MCCFSCVTAIQYLLNPPTGSRKTVSDGCRMSDDHIPDDTSPPDLGDKADQEIRDHNLSIDVPTSSDEE